MAGACYRPRLGAAVQLEVAAVLRHTEGLRRDRRELLVSRGCFGTNQKLIWCCEAGERILGLIVKFLALRGYVALSGLADLSLGSWWFQECGGRLSRSYYAAWQDLQVLGCYFVGDGFFYR